MLTRGRLLALIAISTLLVILALWLLRLSGLEREILDFLASLRDGGPRAWAIFFVAVAVAVVALLPSVLLTTGAGFLFGLFGGSALLLSAELTGATLAFLIARRVLPERLARRIRRHESMRPIERVMDAESWRFVLLLRLIPFFPYKLSNYALGLTSVSLRDYVIGTALGIVPITVFNVYLGSLASNVFALGDRGGPQRPEEWALYVGGFAVLGVAIFVLGRRANRRFEAIQHDDAPADAPPSCECTREGPERQVAET